MSAAVLQTASLGLAFVGACVAAGKLTVPADLAIAFVDPPVAGRAAVVVVTATARRPLHDVRLDVRTDGAVSTAEADGTARYAPSRDAYRTTVPVQIARDGRGHVSATLTAVDADGVTFDRTASLFVTVDTAGVRAGTRDFAEPDLPPAGSFAAAEPSR